MSVDVVKYDAVAFRFGLMGVKSKERDEDLFFLLSTSHFIAPSIRIQSPLNHDLARFPPFICATI